MVELGISNSFRLRSALAALVTSAVLATACGGGGGGGSSVSTTHAPVLSGLEYSPASMMQSPGATVAVFGWANFADAGGDIAAMRLVAPAANVDVTVPTPVAAGVTSGRAMLTLTVSLDTIGRYTFEVWLVDSQGSTSNRLSGTFEVLLDDTATKWRELPVPSAQGRTLLGVAASGQQYVSVGQSGTIVASADLATWTARMSGVTKDLYSVAWSGSRHVAVGNDGFGEAVVLSSVDAMSWTVQYWAGECQNGTCARPANLRKVIWAGSQFVAVGTERVSTTAGLVDYGLILTSPDGVNWTQRAKDSLPAGYTGGSVPGMADVAWSGTTLVAVGTAPSSQSPAAWTSPDGITWTFRPISTGYTILQSVTWGRGYFVAGGLGYGSYRSPDGVTWQGGATVVSPVSAMTAGPSRYLALRRPISPSSSIDGLVWTDISAFPNCWGEVIWDRTRYVAVGDGGKVCVSP